MLIPQRPVLLGPGRYKIVVTVSTRHFIWLDNLTNFLTTFLVTLSDFAILRSGMAFLVTAMFPKCQVLGVWCRDLNHASGPAPCAPV